MNPASDIAFTPAVKALQVERGSRSSYAKMEERGGFRTAISDDLAEFLGEVDTAYLATVNSAGQPYAQHRGGPKGFIRMIGPQTLAFADYTGNRQYITTGNLAESDKAFLFLMDYANRRRIKIWGRARVVADDTAGSRSGAVPGWWRTTRLCSRLRHGTSIARNIFRGSSMPPT